MRLKTNTSAKILIFPDLEAISRHAASIFINLSQNCIASHGRFTVAISGGSTPRKLYTILGSEPYRSLIDWGNVYFFWTDERCVSKNSEESNFKTAFDALFSKILLPAQNTHRIKGEESPEKAAGEYEKDMCEFFGNSKVIFDLILLGMGEDGHTASLFPSSKALEETKRLAVPVYMGKNKINRVTLTLPVLNNAAQILFLAAGRLKADIILKVLGNRDKSYPAGLINPVHGSLHWLIDKEAAEKLISSGKASNNLTISESAD
ncbi:MAG: 6-phosphogluconolactonase [Nitrospirae bacterium]|nr:6-phosphogluconolactonase [Nitrospirota bacterium]